LALALVRSALAGNLGLELDLDAASDLAALPADVALFSESNGRFVVSVAPTDSARFESLLGAQPISRLGTVSAQRVLHLRHAGQSIVRVVLDDLRAAFKGRLGSLS
jgi:phosphoribosylformylglycinamidine synthase